MPRSVRGSCCEAFRVPCLALPCRRFPPASARLPPPAGLAGSSSDEGQSELKENRAPPSKRARKALAAGAAGRRGGAGGSRARTSREAQALLEQSRRLQMRRA